MGRRLRLADGAGSQSLKLKRAGKPIALDNAPAAIASRSPDRRLFNRRNRRKKRLSPTLIAFQNSGHCRRAPGKQIRSASPWRLDQTDAAPRRRRRFGRADCARRRSKRQTQCRPPFGAPALQAHLAARQAQRGPLGAVWSPAPVCHPIRISSPAGQTGRRDAACSALSPGAARIVAFTQQSEQSLKKPEHFSNCSKRRHKRIISSRICQKTPVSPKFCDLTAQGASGF